MTASCGAAHGKAAEDMNQVKRQVSALTSLIQESIVPVVKTLKRAYDDSMGDEPCESLDHLSDQEAEEGDSDAESPPVSKKPKVADGECSAIVHFKRLCSWYFVKEMKTLSILLEYNMIFRKTNLKPFLKYIQKVSNHPDYQI